MVLRDRLGDAADSVLRDLRFAWRALLRSPAFTLAAIASLAIGIGATTAVFSLADAVLLRALPLPDPDRLVEMIAVFPDGHRQTNLEPEAFDVLRREGVSTAEVFAQAFDRVGLRTVGDAAAPVDVSTSPATTSTRWARVRRRGGCCRSRTTARSTAHGRAKYSSPEVR